MKMMLIKIGGSVLENLENLLGDLPSEDLIIVHGGGKEVTRIAEQMGKEQKFIISPSGHKSRYTDKETIEIFQMVIAGLINKNIVRILTKLDRKSIGLCGLDSGLIKAERKKKLISVENGRRLLIDGGYTGKIIEINVELLRMFSDNNIIPVIGALAISEEFEPLNIDGDRLVATISQNMNINKIVFLTDQNGIIGTDGKPISKINKSVLEEIEVGFGMKQKLQGCMNSRAKEIIIANGLIEKPFSDMKGTVIDND